mmetsp:Transcript_21324/g.44890  ORF Transcript_21324/g.44890 Transcript_21324/m.44890 type:complete len:95 (-) Transcript_21324:1070-1354(-)
MKQSYENENSCRRTLKKRNFSLRSNFVSAIDPESAARKKGPTQEKRPTEEPPSSIGFWCLLGLNAHRRFIWFSSKYLLWGSSVGHSSWLEIQAY